MISKKKKQGRVYLVGAGPGDVGLITLKALDCLKQADVIYYDFLVNLELMHFAPAHCQKIYAGKKGGRHTLEQAEIIARMLRDARQGRQVVRLKGGDPFLFGRGGEEALALAKAGVPFEIVPGVSSAMAVPAYAGIPMTHRDYASSVAFITGHERQEQAGEPRGVIPAFDWQALAGVDTLSILMGVKNLPEIVLQLKQAGRSGETPVAIVEWGTLPVQRTVTGTLHDIVEKAERAQIKPPAVIVVGEVVRLRSSLQWFEKRPLFGRRILVTRSRDQASDLSWRLKAYGAAVYEIPTIEFQPPRSWRPLDRSLHRLSDYHWIVFTSVNAVQNFLTRLFQQRKDLRALAGLKVAAIGAATAEYLADQGILVDTMPQEFRSEGLVEIFKKKKIRGQRILIPRARRGQENLITQLRRLGARVDLVEAYQAVTPKEGGGELRQLLKENQIDLVTFASSATAENFFRMLGAGGRKLMKGVTIACIGPVTAKMVRALGFKVSIVPERSTIPDLVKAIL